MRIFLSPPYLNGRDERESMSRAFDTGYIAPCGPCVDAFEKMAAERFGFAYTLATVSGTMALELIARAMEIKPGDEIIASDLTFIASIGPFVSLGATPVFVGSNAKSWTIDPAALELALQTHPRARAVVATDLYGQCCDMDALAQLCERYHVKLISDAAESVGATYQGRSSGRGAWAAVYSFNGNKIITSGGGGMLLTQDAELAAKVRKIAGQSREATPWYEHTMLGTHGRMSNLTAAVACAQLEHLEDALRDKARVWEAWNQRFESRTWIHPMPQASYGVANHWLTVVTLDGINPLDAVSAFNAMGIESRPMWKPMHLQPVFKTAESLETLLDDQLFAHGLCLPSGRGLEPSVMDEMITCLETLHK